MNPSLVIVAILDVLEKSQAIGAMRMKNIARNCNVGLLLDGVRSKLLRLHRFRVLLV